MTTANPFCHVELSTDNTKKAEGFYKKLFKWKLKSLPGEMPYTMIDTGSKQVGGGVTGKSMKGQPTQWMPYVEVKSVKVSLAKAKKLGATVVVDYMPIEPMGAIGVIVDPTGASIGLWQKKV